MKQQWEQSILGRCAKACAFWFATVAVCLAQSDGTALARGAQQVRERSYALAVGTLQGLPARVPLMADYSSYYLGQAYFEQRNYPAALVALRSTYTHIPLSPFAWRAVILSASAYVEMARANDAIALIKQYYNKIPQSNAEAALARSYEALGDPLSAVAGWQRVYYSYPNSDAAPDAQLALVRLKENLNGKYPLPSGQMILTRTKGLADGRRYRDAKSELETALALLGGTERDLAKVRIGVMEYQAKQLLPAYLYLRRLELPSGEADAERYYHLVHVAKRLDREDDMNLHLKALEQKYPQSPWRMEALVTAGYLYLSRNESSQAEAIYRACADGFPENQQASFCHWKLTWANYLRNSADRDGLLKSHVMRFPSSEKVPASLYFLGRLNEIQDAASAKAYYSFLDHGYPNHYYAVLARERLQTPELRAADVSADAQGFLVSITFPNKRSTVSFEPTEVTRQRLARSKYLLSAGLAEWAELELRFAARTDGQPQVVAIELARVLEKRGATDEALRAVKAYVPNYLTFPMESAPASFWRVAFPLPYKESLERYSRQKSLDPYLVAGLIRQESEFNPKAISVAKAYGLTQVLPSTGRSLSRQVGIGRFAPKMLFEPDINLRLGTHYLRQLVDSLNGKWEESLASYNAGRSRVIRWLNWSAYREPSEFIETIPITETRDYVQVVLRNASVYRKLYGTAAATVAENSRGGGKPVPTRIVARRRK